MGRRGRNNLTEEHFFFVTSTTKNFTPVFQHGNCCDLLIKNINHYQKKYLFKILAYVIMPRHFHWILFLENNNGSVSDIMRDIKKYSAWDILCYLENSNNSNLLAQLGHPIKNNQKRQLWMHRFDDQVIRNEKMFWDKLRYILKNPVEAGLVDKTEDYKYSSAKSYIEGKDYLLKIDRDFVGHEMINFIT